MDQTPHWTQRVVAAAVPLFLPGGPLGHAIFLSNILGIFHDSFLKHELFNSFPLEDFFFLAYLQVDMETHRTSVNRSGEIPFSGQ